MLLQLDGHNFALTALPEIMKNPKIKQLRFIFIYICLSRVRDECQMKLNIEIDNLTHQ